ncbi:MAG: hypothetical protein ACP5SG_05680 [Dissulfurimicrobium sp.]|uniref:hypothetical protein n=1 Tax=Dissulfurimicrobium TaxID=1769732 RepID=UPI003C749905
MSDVLINDVKDNEQPAKSESEPCYMIRTIDDLYELIRTNEKWREALRRELLSPALLRLPEDFSRFREEEFKPLATEFHRFREEEFKPLVKKVDVIEQDVAILKQNVARLNIDVADLQGSDLERRVREKAPAYLGKIIRRCRTLTHDKLAELLDDAVDAHKITAEMRADAVLADVVVIGRLFEGMQRDVVLAVEVSKVVDVEDVRRAGRRAAIIGKAMGVDGIGVAFGKSCTEGARAAADEQKDVVLICQG